jgi:cysteate synthase
MHGEHYTLECLGCGKRFADTGRGFLLGCNGSHPPALLRARYAERQLRVVERGRGIFRYAGWLPVRRSLRARARPAVYRSSALAERLGLQNLWLAFSGFWPERGAFFETCSFKELEACCVLARLPEGEERTLVVSSAGNTGRAFLQLASELGLPLLVVVPEEVLPQMWLTVEKHPKVRLAALQGAGDYLDAIELGNRIAAQEGYHPEGGAKNVARRDGMGTVMLAAAEAIGRIPEHYVQAVGSGTGGIAAWEMSMRLAEDGRFGRAVTRLHFVQNEPFAIMTDSWWRGSRELLPLGEAEAKRRIASLHATVLSNRRPPYGVIGGVYDALRATDGQMYAVSGEEARSAGALFEELEGCDLDPAAEVAVAGLASAVRMGTIGREELVLLHLTGGGVKRLQRERRCRQVAPDLVFTSREASPAAAGSRVSESAERVIA